MNITQKYRKVPIGEKALSFHPAERSDTKVDAVGIEMAVLSLVTDDQDGVALLSRPAHEFRHA